MGKLNPIVFNLLNNLILLNGSLINPKPINALLVFYNNFSKSTSFPING